MSASDADYVRLSVEYGAEHVMTVAITRLVNATMHTIDEHTKITRLSSQTSAHLGLSAGNSTVVVCRALSIHRQ